MDTNKDSAVSDVPTFKVARVGNDRKRKGGGLSFLRGSGTRGVWSGAAGGSGAGAASGGAAAMLGGLNLSQAMLVLLVSVLGLGAVGLGRMLGNMSDNEVKKPKAFSMASKDPVKIEGDTSNLPSNASTIPNSMGYVTGSKDGLTPEERAKKEADAAAAAEAQRLADEAAAKKAEKDNLAGKAVDPKDLLASAKADGGNNNNKGSAFGKKFGSLSSSMGGGSGLSGGAGLSGGVNRQFGSSGSISKGAGGQLSAMKGSSRPGYSKSGGARAAASNTKGFARKQLANANAYSRRATTAGSAETAASDAGSAFVDKPGSNVISGPGVGTGVAPASSGGTNPTATSGGNSGGPTGSTQTDCGANKYQKADGTCADIPTNGGKDANPMLSMMADAVMALLLIIGIISAIAAATGPWGYWMNSVLLGMAIIITVLGAAMAAMGDYVTGGIATLIGGIATYLCWTPGALTVGQGMVVGFGGAALTLVSQMLTSNKDKAPTAAQQ